MGIRGTVARAAGAIALTAALAAPGTASAAPALTDTCRQVKGLSALLTPVCRTVQQATSAVSATCRTLTDSSPLCALPLTPSVTRAEIEAVERGWLGAALARQSRLADDLGFADAPWVTTHNSFNSIAEMGPTLSAVDANQQLSLVDQLRVGIRGLELDLHDLTAGRGPAVCHGTGPHIGCTVEKSLGPTLAPIRDWLDAHPGEVVLLYLENQLQTTWAEADAVQALRNHLGSRVYEASGGTCEKLPLDGGLTRSAVRAAGKQVVLVSNGCGSGSGWRSLVFNWRDRDEERPKGFRAFPACGAHTPGLDRLVRYFEDGTALTAIQSIGGGATLDDGITAATAKAMTDCGVDVIGFDHLVPNDGRLEAVVWSWARDEPRAAGGDCAALRADGRWEARSCGAAPLRAACVAADGSWSLSAPVPAAGAAAACATLGRTHAVPRTGREGALLRAAAAGQPAWLALQRGAPGF